MGAELERLDAAAQRGELIDGLRALITARSDAGGESIIGTSHAILAEPYVLRPHCDPDCRARIEPRRRERREALHARFDRGKFAVARKHAAGEQVRCAGELGHKKTAPTILHLLV